MPTRISSEADPVVVRAVAGDAVVPAVVDRAVDLDLEDWEVVVAAEWAPCLGQRIRAANITSHSVPRH